MILGSLIASGSSCLAWPLRADRARAIGTEAVSHFGRRVRADVELHGMPTALVVLDLLAGEADWQHSGKRMYFLQRAFQFRVGPREGSLGFITLAERGLQFHEVAPQFHLCKHLACECAESLVLLLRKMTRDKINDAQRPQCML